MNRRIEAPLYEIENIQQDARLSFESENESQSESVTMRPRDRLSTRPNVENVESRCEITMRVEFLSVLRRT
jgi:hypothetical protein